MTNDECIKVIQEQCTNEELNAIVKLLSMPNLKKLAMNIISKY